MGGLTYCVSLCNSQHNPNSWPAQVCAGWECHKSAVTYFYATPEGVRPGTNMRQPPMPPWEWEDVCWPYIGYNCALSA